ncbi:MAG: hypothetical protein H0W62_12225 [Chitinophagales bacterium]|nr:hypothetical protein [Chitinophagales bacterium]
MKNQIKILTLVLSISLFFVSVVFFSCNKNSDPRQPPDMSLQTGAGYTFTDATVALGDTLKVGVVVIKTEDPLNTFNVSYVYDAGSSSTTVLNQTLTGSEQNNGFSRDITIATRNQAGVEKYTFTVVDRDGNIASKSLTITVQ